MSWQVSHKKKKATLFFIIFIITGSLSLGAFVEQEGYKAFISPRQPTPGEWKYFPGKILDNNYYQSLISTILGGYTVERHGSRDQGTFDSVSVETPREVRIDAGRDTRVEFGQALGRAIAQFYVANYPQIGQLYVANYPLSSILYPLSSIPNYPLNLS